MPPPPIFSFGGRLPPLPPPPPPQGRRLCSQLHNLQNKTPTSRKCKPSKQAWIIFRISTFQNCYFFLKFCWYVRHFCRYILMTLNLEILAGGGGPIPLVDIGTYRRHHLATAPGGGGGHCHRRLYQMREHRPQKSTLNEDLMIYQKTP